MWSDGIVQAEVRSVPAGDERESSLTCRGRQFDMSGMGEQSLEASRSCCILSGNVGQHNAKTSSVDRRYGRACGMRTRLRDKRDPSGQFHARAP